MMFVLSFALGTVEEDFRLLDVPEEGQWVDSAHFMHGDEFSVRNLVASFAAATKLPVVVRKHEGPRPGRLCVVEPLAPAQLEAMKDLPMIALFKELVG